MSARWMDDVPDGIDLPRLLEIEHAVTVVARKLTEHRLRGYKTINLGAFDALLAALYGPLPTVLACDTDPADTFSAGYASSGEPYPLDDVLDVLLEPGPVELDSTAARLEELGRRIYPRAGDSSGGEVA